MGVFMRIYIVGTEFGDYVKQISNEFIKKGYDVKTLVYRGVVPCDFKFSSRLLSVLFLICGIIVSFAARLIFTIKLVRMVSESDSLLVLHGGFLSSLPLFFLRTKKSVVWLMDPLFRFPTVSIIFRFFRFRFTYDVRDLKYLHASLLPLFADTKIYVRPPETRNKYVVGFVGAMSIHRAIFLEKLLNLFSHGEEVYIGGIYAKLSLKTRDFILQRCPKLSSVFVEKVHSHAEIADIYAVSDFVVNFHAEQHFGFSMRTFEALALGKVQIVDVFRKNEFPISYFPEFFIDSNTLFAQGKSISVFETKILENKDLAFYAASLSLRVEFLDELLSKKSEGGCLVNSFESTFESTYTKLTS